MGLLSPCPLLPAARWGYIYTADWQVDTGGAPHEVKDHTLPNLQRQSAESETLLGSHMNLYQVGEDAAWVTHEPVSGGRGRCLGHI